MLIYAPLLAVLILISAAISIGILRVYRPGFAYAWIIAALGAMAAWSLVLLSTLSAPQIISLASWELEPYFPSSPGLVVDQISWSFSLAISTLVLSVILTDSARASEADSSAWAGSLALSGVGIFAVLAENPLTLLYAWTAIDVTQLVIMRWRLEPGEGLGKVIIGLSVRMTGIVLLILAMIYIPSSDASLGFQALPSIAGILLFLAAGLRLGVLPIRGVYLQDYKLPRSLGSISQLVPAATSLLLIVRIANSSASINFLPLLLVLSWLVAIYGGYLWIISRDELEGMPYWIIGVGSLAFAAALKGGIEASLAWSIVGVLTGGLIFLMSAHQKYSIVFVILGLVTLSGVPYTPTSNGMALYSEPYDPLLFVFVLPHALLMAGYLKQGTHERETLPGVERWVTIIYPWGLVLLLLAQVLVNWWGVRPTFMPIGGLAALITLVLATLIYWAYLRGYRIPHLVQDIFESIISLRWLSRIIESIYTITARILNGVSLVLEGEGGVLWAIVLLILLIAYFTQVGIGE
jgi:hypothetical protein